MTWISKKGAKQVEEYYKDIKLIKIDNSQKEIREQRGAKIIQFLGKIFN